MPVLVLNAGSSSLKADVLDPSTGRRLASVRAERVADHAVALRDALPSLTEVPIEAVGHRVVHGGERFTRPVLIDDEVEAAIDGLGRLAPLHNPANLAGIRAARRALPDVAHVAVFDTAFHATLPRRARTYAIDRTLAVERGYRRFGFHGPSHGWVAGQAARHLGEDIRDLRIVTCHLGSGASCCAVEYGRSVDTTMGFTPLEGLVMGTRSGDLDPGILVDLVRAGWDADRLDELLNRRSGLAGVSGAGNDLRDIVARAAEGDDRCRLALHVFCHRLRKTVGAYAAVMGGADAIVFTAGIGENSALVRHRVCQRLDFLGARLDEDRNRDASVSLDEPVATISQPHSRVRLLVVATDEARAIGTAALELARAADAVETRSTIPVSVSARHIHLTPDAVETLFGPGHRLTPRNPITQPGQFAAEEKVTIVGPRNELKARILGPARSRCQVEISQTDEFFLGIDAPVRESGDVANSPGCTLVGPAGSLPLTEGVICAWRHIHMTPADAEHFGVADRDIVDVAIDSGGRDLVFGDVMVRVKDSYALEMHIDTDEANAAGIARGAHGLLAPTGSVARLTRRSTRFDR